MMLKIKVQLNYKRGGTCRNCGCCDHFVRKIQCVGIGGRDLGSQPRCRIIGLQSGRMYMINEKNICDRFDNEQGLRRLLGNRAYDQLKEMSHEAA